MKNRIRGSAMLMLIAFSELLHYTRIVFGQFSMRLKYIKYILVYNVYPMMGSDELQRFANVGSLLNGIVGPSLASAATIAPNYGVHHVTGVVAIVNITAPYTGFQGPVVFIPDSGIWTWTAAGNIGVAGTVTAANGVPVTFFFDGLKWWPDRIS